MEDHYPWLECCYCKERFYYDLRERDIGTGYEVPIDTDTELICEECGKEITLVVKTIGFQYLVIAYNKVSPWVNSVEECLCSECSKRVEIGYYDFEETDHKYYNCSCGNEIEVYYRWNFELSSKVRYKDEDEEGEEDEKGKETENVLSGQS